MRKEEEEIAIPKMPKRFWEDDRWANEHYSELTEEYPNQWIAVVGKKVVAYGKNLAEVEKEARKKTSEDYISLTFAEGDIHVW
ncbi:MAG: hypothetical protein KAU14_10295 [Thermoplasmata archaeon]|nr:hypothetical protein [Thermoplasmata archaeon]